VTVGGYFLRSNFPAMAGHIAQAGYLVARSERGRGVGTRLLGHSLEEAACYGYRAMMFNLVQESNPSRRLYERAGFQVIGRIPQVHDAEAGLIYWRELSDVGPVVPPGGDPGS
jgi:ribosomal protein S18 acetylase RimI-like enzyme